MQNCDNSRAVSNVTWPHASKLGSWPSVRSRKGNGNNQCEFVSHAALMPDLTESLVRILQGHQSYIHVRDVDISAHKLSWTQPD